MPRGSKAIWDRSVKHNGTTSVEYANSWIAHSLCNCSTLFVKRLMIICGLLAAELAEDWFQGLSQGWWLYVGYVYVIVWVWIVVTVMTGGITVTSRVTIAWGIVTWGITLSAKQGGNEQVLTLDAQRTRYLQHIHAWYLLCSGRHEEEEGEGEGVGVVPVSSGWWLAGSTACLYQATTTKKVLDTSRYTKWNK